MTKALISDILDIMSERQTLLPRHQGGVDRTTAGTVRDPSIDDETRKRLDTIHQRKKSLSDLLLDIRGKDIEVYGAYNNRKDLEGRINETIGLLDITEKYISKSTEIHDDDVDEFWSEVVNILKERAIEVANQGWIDECEHANTVGLRELFPVDNPHLTNTDHPLLVGVPSAPTWAERYNLGKNTAMREYCSLIASLRSELSCSIRTLTPQIGDVLDEIQSQTIPAKASYKRAYYEERSSAEGARLQELINSAQKEICTVRIHTEGNAFRQAAHEDVTVSLVDTKVIAAACSAYRRLLREMDIPQEKELTKEVNSIFREIEGLAHSKGASAAKELLDALFATTIEKLRSQLVDKGSSLSLAHAAVMGTEVAESVARPSVKGKVENVDKTPDLGVATTGTESQAPLNIQKVSLTRDIAPWLSDCVDREVLGVYGDSMSDGRVVIVLDLLSESMREITATLSGFEGLNSMDKLGNHSGFNRLFGKHLETIANGLATSLKGQVQGLEIVKLQDERRYPYNIWYLKKIGPNAPRIYVCHIPVTADLLEKLPSESSEYLTEDMHIIGLVGAGNKATQVEMFREMSGGVIRKDNKQGTGSI